MSKILYPIFKLPSENEDDVEYQAIPTWIKWWLLNNYNKKHSWVLSEIITGNPLTLENSVATKFYLPPLPRGNSTQVQYSGKNLFTTTDNFVFVSGSTTYEIKGENSLKVTSTGDTYSYRYVRFKLENLTIGQTYYIKANFSNSNANYNKGPLYVRNANDSSSLNANDNYVSGSSMSFVPTETTVNIRFYASAGTALINTCTWSEIMISSTNNDTYEPYCGGTASPNPSYPQSISNVTGDVEVLVQNKNLFDVSKITESRYINSITGVDYTSNASNITDYIFVKANITCAFSFNYTSLIASSDRGWALYDTNKTFINGNRVYSPSSKKVIFTPTQDGYVRFTYDKNCTDIMLEQNTTETTYTPHQEQTYTFPLGTQRMYLGDYLADDGIHHVRKQIVLDGSSDEDWSHYSNSSAPYRIVINDMKPSSSDNIIPNVKCTHFEAVEWNANFNNYTYLITMHLNNNYLAFRDTDITSLADWKTWLSNNNLIVEYLLEQEEIAPYTTEQQQAYDEIKQAISYEEQTNISGSSDESNPLFEVQYYMKNESEGE